MKLLFYNRVQSLPIGFMLYGSLGERVGATQKTEKAAEEQSRQPIPIPDWKDQLHAEELKT